MRLCNLLACTGVMMRCSRISHTKSISSSGVLIGSPCAFRSHVSPCSSVTRIVKVRCSLWGSIVEGFMNVAIVVLGIDLGALWRIFRRFVAALTWTNQQPVSGNVWTLCEVSQDSNFWTSSHVLIAMMISSIAIAIASVIRIASLILSIVFVALSVWFVVFLLVYIARPNASSMKVRWIAVSHNLHRTLETAPDLPHLCKWCNGN